MVLPSSSGGESKALAMVYNAREGLWDLTNQDAKEVNSLVGLLLDILWLLGEVCALVKE